MYIPFPTFRAECRWLKCFYTKIVFFENQVFIIMYTMQYAAIKF